MREYQIVKLFTPDEANEALAVVRPLAERLVERRRAFLRFESELDPLQAKLLGNGGGLDMRRLSELQRAVAETAAEVRATVEELDALGVQVKDLDSGLLDFPAEHPADGSTVLLCWRLGEPGVAHWHGLADGFAGRKPLPF